MGKIYAYCRIFPDSMDDSEQIVAMREMQVAAADIFADRETEDDKNRRNYKKLVKRLKPGDLLYMRNMSALGDSYPEIRTEWEFLTKVKEVDISLLEMPHIDTRRGKLQYGNLIADIILEMLDYVSEAERSVRRRKQREGIEEARRKGTRFGRSPLPIPDNFYMVYQKWSCKEISGDEAARLCGLTRGTFYRRAKQAGQGENFAKKEDKAHG